MSRHQKVAASLEGGVLVVEAGQAEGEQVSRDSQYLTRIPRDPATLASWIRSRVPVNGDFADGDGSLR
ncbi:MAG TPA: hypothetical protein EYO84_01695 [Planctomycetes bacterium]|nr:hypothetical protein [Planctomycetota bacterium]